MNEVVYTVKDREPPIWDDVMMVLDSGAHMLGYYCGHVRGEDEWCDLNDRRVSGVVGWYPVKFDD